MHDSIARSLRTGSTQTVGLAISAISNPFFAEVVGAIERQVTTMRRKVLLVDTHDDPEQEFSAVQELVARRCDGVILAPSAAPEQTYDLLERRNMPTVLIDRFSDTGTFVADSIGVHNEEPVAQLVDHVASRGHRRVAFVAGLPGLGTSLERLAGFKLGVQRNKLDPDPDSWCSEAPTRPPHAMLSPGFRPAGAPHRHRHGQQRHDHRCHACDRQPDLRIPEDVGLVGFDDFPWAPLFRPRLTVVAQPLTELGTRAATMLHERIANPSFQPDKFDSQPP